jgi:hypothetical protein
MRRSILVAILVGALVGVAAVAGVSLAGSDSEKKANAPQQSFQASYAAKQDRGGRRHGGRHGHGHGMRFGPMAMALSGLADRLNVDKDELIDAAKGVKDKALDRAVSDGTITQAQRDALEGCMKARHGGGGTCNRRVARRAHRKLHRALRKRVKNDLPGLKSQLIGDLADELNKQPAEVEDAIRAELVDLLDTGVKLGFVSERGRTLALGCFDQPAQCDLKALRREARRHHRGHRRGHGGRHP